MSQKAAEQALFETALTRVVLPAPVCLRRGTPPHPYSMQLLLIPPLCMMAVERTPVLRLAPRLALPINAVFCFFSFVFGLPFAISLFPQEGSIPVSKLEPQFHGLVDAAGNPITHLLYNKGL